MTFGTLNYLSPLLQNPEKYFVEREEALAAMSGGKRLKIKIEANTRATIEWVLEKRYEFTLRYALIMHTMIAYLGGEFYACNIVHT